MADDRSVPGSAGEVHDDDELADVLAAELRRYATGAVPTVPRPADAPRPDSAGSVPPNISSAQLSGSAPPSPSPAQIPVRASGRRAAPAAPFVPPRDAGATSSERDGRRVRDVLSWSDAPAAAGADRPPALDEQRPVRRRSGYLPPPGPTAPIDPMERVLPTGPVALPEPTAALLQQMIDDSGDLPGTPRPRHATSPSRTLPPVDPGVLDSLRGTGPLDVPRPLYSDWERSLRSIGRPRSPWDDDETPLRSAGDAPDAPTVAMAVPRLQAPDAPPAVRAARRAQEPPAGAAQRAPEPPAEIERLPIDADPVPDDDGIDDVAAPHPHVSAATTGAIDLPLAEPRPRTGPVLIERVRTAILQLPALPDSPTGSAGAGIAGRWAGAFASPLLLLLAFGLGVLGGRPLDAVPLLIGAAVALPAALRSVAWAALEAEPGEREEDAAFGRAGTAWAVVLLLARIAAGAGALLAVAWLVSAWVARTGVLGGSVATTSLLAAAAAGALAIAAAALPARATAIVVQLLGAAGVVGTVLLVLLLAPSAGGASSGAGAAAAAAGFAAIGLLLVLCGADVARWRTGLAGSLGAAVGTTAGAAAGVAVGGLGLLVATGSRGEPADALAAALSDGTAAGLAAPLAVVLLGSALVLPVLLVRSAGASAARVLGGGGERLGTLAAGLLGLAAAFGVLSAGVPVAQVLVALAGVAGVPVAAWAGVRTLGGTGRSVAAALVAGGATVLGWLLCDGLLPGAASPVLAIAGASRSGPVAGLAAAFLLGLVGGLLSRSSGVRRAAPRDPADTVDG